MATSRDLSILHISDMQFGKYNLFPQAKDVPEEQHDSLHSRLSSDLIELIRSGTRTPDLIVCTGDLAEWGWPKQFSEASRFLSSLAADLKLPKERVVVVPGNHDVNRGECKRYFQNCFESDLPIVPPWNPKWRAYTEFFLSFYGDTSPYRFEPDEPWTLFEFPDLQVVVAGINTTWIEGHDWTDDCLPPDLESRLRPQHKGYCGERQLRWFAQRLSSERYARWLRVGALHHNLERGSSQDDENLIDAPDLESILGEHLDLAFHGHTHNASFGTRQPYFHWFATGSASLNQDTRPTGVPNQYQIVQVGSTVIEVRARMYLEDRRIWSDDPRIADTPHSKTVRIRANWRRNVDWMDVPQLPTTSPSNSVATTFPTLIEELRLCCQLKFPGGHIQTAVVEAPDVFVLHVTHRDGDFIRRLHIGCSVGNAPHGHVQSFLEKSLSQFRSLDPTCEAHFVFTSGVPSQKAKELSQKYKIRLSSITEYRGLIDFSEYIIRQNSRLDSDEIYPPSLYVNQKMEFEIGATKSTTENALVQVQKWLIEPEPRFILVLGDFGTGKTFLVRKVARLLGSDSNAPIPLLIELRGLEKARRLDELLAQHFARHDFVRLDLAALRFMLRQGRIVLLFDGFDELALRVGYSKAAEHLDTMIEAAQGEARVVVTCRTSYFESDKQIRVALAKHVETLRGLRWCRIQRFDDAQIRAFLLNRFGSDETANEWYDLLNRVKDLLGLGHNPRMLSFICQLRQSELVDAAGDREKVSAAKLYEILLLKFWLGYEYEREHPKGAAVLFSPAQLLDPVTEIAFRLWKRTENWISLEELREVVTAAIQEQAPDLISQEASVTHYLGRGTLFVQDDGRFSFVHHSVLEWLVARRIASVLQENSDTDLLSIQPLSLLMAEFLCSLEPMRAQEWATMRVTEAGARGSLQAKNALRIMERLGSSQVAPFKLRNADLRGEDLSRLNLQMADLEGADLRNSLLSGCNLRGANLKNTNLSEAFCDGADFSGAYLERVNARMCSLLGSRFTNASVLGGDWSYARLTACQNWPSDSARSVFFGVGIQSWRVPPPRATVPATCIGWSDDAELIAIGYGDGTCSVIRRRSSHLILRWKASAQAITCLSWLTSGRLAIGSHDAAIRIYVCDGITVPDGVKLYRSLTGHAAAVTCLAWTRNSENLISGGMDSTVRLWDVDGEKELRRHTEHDGTVRCIIISPDETRIVTGGSDRTVRTWTMQDEEAPVLCRVKSEVSALGWSGDRASLFVATTHGDVFEVDAQKGTNSVPLARFHSGAFPIAWTFSSTGAKLALGSKAGVNTVVIQQRWLSDGVFDRFTGVKALAWCPAETYLAIIDEEGQTHVLDTARSGSNLVSPVQPAEVALKRRSTTEFEVTYGGRRSRWDVSRCSQTVLEAIDEVPSGRLREAVSVETDYVSGVHLVAGTQCDLIIRNSKNEELRKIPNAHLTSITAHIWLDSNMLCTASTDGVVKVWHFFVERSMFGLLSNYSLALKASVMLTDGGATIYKPLREEVVSDREVQYIAYSSTLNPDDVVFVSGLSGITRREVQAWLPHLLRNGEKGVANKA